MTTAEDVTTPDPSSGAAAPRLSARLLGSIAVTLALLSATVTFLVLAGFDPTTKKYVGSEAVIRAQIAQVQADKDMPEEDKKEALADLENALKSPAPPVKNKGNIDLVAQYYDRLAEAMGNDQQ